MQNTGTSADLSVLRDISDNQKGALEDEIHNSLNVPLYLGLAGTFVGIITGLIGVDFSQIFGPASDLKGLQHLLYGVVAAMFASCWVWDSRSIIVPYHTRMPYLNPMKVRKSTSIF